MKNLRSIFKNPIYDYFFLLAPFWLGAGYLALIHELPEQKSLIFCAYLIFFGEMHFGATYLFFVNPENRDWIQKRLFRFRIIPVVLIACFVAIGLYSLPAAVLLTALASAFHVTRQSAAIYRMYGGKRHDLNEMFIYFSSFAAMAIGFVRFYVPQLGTNTDFAVTLGHLAPYLTNGLLVIVGIFLIQSAIKLKDFRKWASILVGCAIYLPYCFVETPQDGLAVGVSMHWCQYIAIHYAVYLRPRDEETEPEKRRGVVFFRGIWIFVVLYAVLMSLIQTSFGTETTTTSLLILIPLSGQMLHFYLDSFIWKFSDPHIRQQVSRYLWATGLS